MGKCKGEGWGERGRWRGGREVGEAEDEECGWLGIIWAMEEKKESRAGGGGKSNGGCVFLRHQKKNTPTISRVGVLCRGQTRICRKSAQERKCLGERQREMAIARAIRLR